MAGLQTVTTPVTGTPISSTTFGVPVANNLTVLANPPIARMRNSTTQTAATSTYTALTWDTEDFDTVGGHSTVTNTSRYTVQTGYAGYYRVTGAITWASNATGRRTATIAVNGTNKAGTETNSGAAGSANPWTIFTQAILLLAVGDYVELVGWQNSGGNLATAITGSSESYLEIQWIHA